MTRRDVQLDTVRDDVIELAAEALAQRARNGCRESFDVLATRFRPRLIQFLLRRTGRRDAADDLAQDTLTRAWEHIDSYNPRWRFSTWIFSIASRAAIDELRSRRHAPMSLPDALAAAHDDHEMTTEVGDRLDDIWDASARLLTGMQQSVLWLRYVEELSMREIAAALNKSAVSVRVTLFRARAALAEHLAQASAETDCRAAPLQASQMGRSDHAPRERLVTGVSP